MPWLFGRRAGEYRLFRPEQRLEALWHEAAATSRALVSTVLAGGCCYSGPQRAQEPHEALTTRSADHRTCSPRGSDFGW
jgi:hypothetical protein